MEDDIRQMRQQIEEAENANVEQIVNYRMGVRRPTIPDDIVFEINLHLPARSTPGPNARSMASSKLKCATFRPPVLHKGGWHAIFRL